MRIDWIFTLILLGVIAYQLGSINETINDLRPTVTTIINYNFPVAVWADVYADRVVLGEKGELKSAH